MYKIIYLITILLLVSVCCLAEPDDSSSHAAKSPYLIYTGRSWSAPLPIVFYTKDFANRLGLEDNRVISFEPGLVAIQVLFEREFKLDYDPNDPFIKHYHLDTITPDQRETLNNHLSALPIFFPDEKMPLHVHYNCIINLYLKTDDPRVKDLQFPNRPLWWSNNITDRIVFNMLKPIQDNQIMSAGDPALKNIPDNQPKNLIATYYSYLDKTLDAPQAVLTAAKTDFVNPNKRVLLTFNGHYKDFLPGLHFLSFKVPYCDALDERQISQGPWIWIQKKTNAEQFYVFQIPAEVSRQLIMQRILEFNSRSVAKR